MASICQHETGKNTNVQCLLPVSHRRMIKRLPTFTPHDSFVRVLTRRSTGSLAIYDFNSLAPTNYSTRRTSRNHSSTKYPRHEFEYAGKVCSCRTSEALVPRDSFERQLSSGVTIINQSQTKRQYVQPLFTYPTDCTDLRKARQH